MNLSHVSPSDPIMNHCDIISKRINLEYQSVSAKACIAALRHCLVIVYFFMLQVLHMNHMNIEHPLRSLQVPSMYRTLVCIGYIGMIIQCFLSQMSDDCLAVCLSPAQVINAPAVLRRQTASSLWKGIVAKQVLHPFRWALKPSTIRLSYWTIVGHYWTFSFE